MAATRRRAEPTGPFAALLDRASHSVPIVDSKPVTALMTAAMATDVAVSLSTLAILADLSPKADVMALLFGQSESVFYYATYLYLLESTLRLLLSRGVCLLDPPSGLEFSLSMLQVYAFLSRWSFAYRALLLPRIALRAYRRHRAVCRAMGHELGRIRSARVAADKRTIELQQELDDARDKLRREGQARSRLERMLQVFREDNRTLQDALAMAANTVTYMKARSEGQTEGDRGHVHRGAPSHPPRSLDQEDVLAVLDQLSVADLEQLDRETVAAVAHDTGRALHRRRGGGSDQAQAAEPEAAAGAAASSRGTASDDAEEEESTDGEDDFEGAESEGVEKEY